MTKVIVKELKVRNRNFTVVLDDGWYMAIEDKYITNGKTNRELNGLQTNASQSLSDCIKMTKDAVEIDYLKEQGYSMAEAVAIVFDMMENLEMLKTIYA